MNDNCLSCLGDFARPKVGEFNLANGARNQYFVIGNRLLKLEQYSRGRFNDYHPKRSARFHSREC